MIIAFPPPSWSQVWTKTKKSLASHKIASPLHFKIQTEVPAKTSVNWELEAGNWRIENTKMVWWDLLCVCAHYCIHYIDKGILFRVLDIAGLGTVIFSFSFFFPNHSPVLFHTWHSRELLQSNTYCVPLKKTWTITVINLSLIPRSFSHFQVRYSLTEALTSEVTYMLGDSRSLYNHLQLLKIFFFNIISCFPDKWGSAGSSDSKEAYQNIVSFFSYAFRKHSIFSLEELKLKRSEMRHMG